MRKQLSLMLIISIVCTLGLQAQNRAIEFDHSAWSEIVAKAKSENKLIFVDAYASWCGPCKWMAANTFTNDDVADFYNKNFVCAKIDMEEGEGPELKNKFGVQAYPTLLFVDATEKIVHIAVGGLEPEAFLNLGKDALNPAKQFATYNDKYENGTMASDEYAKYIELLGLAYRDASEVINKYISTLPEDKIATQETWEMLSQNASGVESPAFQAILKHQKEFEKLVTPAGVEKTMVQVYYYDIAQKLYYSEDQELYDAEMKKLKESGFANTKAVKAYVDMALAQRDSDMERYAKAAIELTQSMDIDNWEQLNSMAWSFYEQVDDKGQLKEALKWAEKSVTLNECPENVDTKAALLFKLGQIDEAQKVEEHAIELAKQAGKDTSGYEEMLQRIKDAR